MKHLPANPILARVTRGGRSESIHRGAYAVVDDCGQVISSAGDITLPIFPRSAIKAFQCLALLQNDGADQFGLSDEEIAVACSSHNAEPRHLDVVSSLLRKAGNSPDHFECGSHLPIAEAAKNQLITSKMEPAPIHNNCSGKHAGMLALARLLGVPTEGYVQLGHPVQQAVAKALGEICEVTLTDETPCGVDGCSVPTWPLPLKAIATGFWRFTDPSHSHAQRILHAVKKHAFLVAGSERFDTMLMERVPRAFVKTGAEGVYAACVPHARIGVAVKVDDGAKRASELIVAQVLASLEVWTAEEQSALEDLAQGELCNWRGLQVGVKEALF